MKRIVAALILALVFLTPVIPVQAQSNVVFDKMTIEIWPEYDRPDVLIIYRITIDPTVTLPVQVSLTIPRDAGTPYNIAMQDLDGLLYNLAYTTEIQDDTQKVIFTTPAASLQIEYYDPRLTKDGSKRQFTFAFDAEFLINNLNISVQQPANAADMQILPSFGAGQVNQDGLTYFNNAIGKVASGTHLSVQVNYTKPDDQLSVGLLPVEPSQPLSTTNTGVTTSSIDILPWVLGGIGIVLLVGGILWFWFTRNKTAGAGAGRKRHRVVAESTRAVSDDEAIYCHQCGKRSSEGDVFCRTCGTRLRAG